MTESAKDRQAASAGGGLNLQQALEEAQRCLLCDDAPCSKGCPGATDPGRFIRQIRFYNLKGAARTVLRNNPLGGVCAYVCPTEDTCVRECLRAGLDRPIDIDGLQRFAVEYGRAHGVTALAPGKKKRSRVAVVGAGPAGLTTAAQLAVLGYPVTLFESKSAPGGMLRYGVPPARLPGSALDADLKEILDLGVELQCDTPIEKDGAKRLLNEGYAAVFVAPGLWEPISLQIPGIDLDPVTTAIDFLAQVRTAPDQIASLVKGKNVAIIGGGSVAMDAALCARQAGANRIYAIALESMTELPANDNELEQARRDGVIIKPQCHVTKILSDNGKVCGVAGVETEWIEPGKLTPDNARPIDGTSFTLRVDVVVQAIGQKASAVGGQIITSVENKAGLIEANAKSQATSADRVFAGGDIVRGPATVVAAVGDGKRAAYAIDALLSNKGGAQ